MDAEIKIEGLDGIQDKLDQLLPKQQLAVWRKAVQAGDDVFLAAAREQAPVAATDSKGNSLPPGFLASDISARTRVTDQGVVGTISFGKLSRHVADWVENGHRIVTGGRSYKNKTTGKTRGPGTEVGSTTPNPFMARAFEEALQPAIDAVQNTILSSLRKKGLIK